jgi:ribonuclease D
MLTLAAERPATREALGSIRGVGRGLLASNGDELLAAVARGMEVPENQLPRFTRSPRPKPDPAADVRLERLRVVRTGLATELELQPGVLCPNSTLEAIARRNPASLEVLGSVEGVRRWQVAAIGEKLLAALPDAG